MSKRGWSGNSDGDFEETERQRTSRRKRKKRRKKRLPKSSSRHPPSSPCSYSTSPSFWQSPVRCPGVARFNSVYSPFVGSQMLWMSFILSVCSWTRILRSFLNLDILLRTPGIWQPLFALPKMYRKNGFSARRLQPVFPESPWYLAVTCSVSVQCLPRQMSTENLEFSGQGLVFSRRPLVSGSHSLDTGLAGGVQYADSSGT